MDAVKIALEVLPLINALNDLPYGEGLKFCAEQVAAAGVSVSIGGGWSAAQAKVASRRNSDLERMLQDAWDRALDDQCKLSAPETRRWKQVKNAGHQALAPENDCYPTTFLSAVLFESPATGRWTSGWDALLQALGNDAGLTTELILAPAEFADLEQFIHKRFGEMLKQKKHEKALIAFQREMLRETVAQLKHLGETQAEILSKLEALAEIPDLVAGLHMLLTMVPAHSDEQRRTDARQLEVLANLFDALDKIEHDLRSVGARPLMVEGKELNLRFAASCERVRVSLLDSEEAPVVGRDSQYEAFDTIVREQPYVLVTGAAGSGKSSFLANWLERHKDDSDMRCSYHFFSAQQGTAEIGGGMKCICEQLLDDYRLDVPALEIEHEKLKRIFEELATIPRVATRTVVVLEGVDEAINQSKPKSDLAFDASWIPKPLPERVTLIISIRDVEGANTHSTIAKELGLEDRLEPFQIDHLKEADISSLIEKKNLPDDFEQWAGESKIASRIVERTGGLAIYVRFLVDELSKSSNSDDREAVFEQLPRDFKTYIERAIRQLRGDYTSWIDAFKQLCLAKGPLTAAELIALTELKAEHFASLPDWPVLRWLRTSGAGIGAQYAFSHDSIRSGFEQVLLDPLAPEERIKTQNALLRFCASWKENQIGRRSTYALRYYPQHLLDAVLDGSSERPKELYELCQCEGFLDAQRAAFTGESDIHLQTIREGIRAAAWQEEVVPLATLILLHARTFGALRSESPLEAARQGNLERAFSLALSLDAARSVLFLVLIAWDRHVAGDGDGPSRAFEFLNDCPAVSLRGRESELLRRALVDLLETEMSKSQNEGVLRHMSDDSLLEFTRTLVASERIAEALATARTIDDTYPKADALATIAQAQATAGQFAEALATAYTIERVDARADVLALIAQAQAAAGQENEARTTFAEALATARTIDDTYVKADMLATIAQAQAALGQLAAALATAHTFDDPDAKAEAFKTIAQAQAAAGQANEARTTFAEALATTQAIVGEDRRVRSLAELVSLLPTNDNSLYGWIEALIAAADDERSAIACLPVLARKDLNAAGKITELLTNPALPVL